MPKRTEPTAEKKGSSEEKDNGRLVEAEVFDGFGNVIEAEKATERDTKDVDDFDEPVAKFFQGIERSKCD